MSRTLFSNKNKFKMGIINGLLTGGILIGKICQALAPGFLEKSGDSDNANAMSGEVESGGVSFYRKDVGGVSMVHAANLSTKSSASIVVPNGTDQGGVIYVIDPISTIPFAEAESALVSPSTNVTTGLTSLDTVTGANLAGPGSLFKLAFNGLRFGQTVNIGSFRVRCTTTQLTIVTTALTANALTYMWLTSDKGVSASSQNRIPPTDPPANPSGNVAAEIEQTFPVDFASLGIDVTKDVIDGQITLEYGPSVSLSVFSKIKSTPLDETERAYFQRRGKLQV